jgi:2,4-dienoyl-CoA reductase-like NADH-dependent reductase (Old Yellow Enzyme family)
MAIDRCLPTVSHRNRPAKVHMLDRPIQLPCGLSLSNRLVKASMTERMATPDGRPTERHAALFRRFAEGGSGLLLTGNVVVDGHHLEAFGNVTFETAQDLEPYRQWARAGGVAPIVMQLNHPGRQAMRAVAREPVAPSAVGLPNKKYFATPRAMEEGEVLATIEQFASAARTAERAGFAGVEVHAAHGYLISQFLAPNVNRRTDQWGGSLANRSRLLLRVVERIRETVSSDFAVGVKLNAGDFVKGGLEVEDAIAVMGELGRRSIDFIEVSGGTFERPASFGHGLSESTRAREGYFIEMAQRARDVTSVPLIVTGGWRSAVGMTEAIRSGACDLVGLARPLAAEPALPLRLMADPQARAQVPVLKHPKGPIASLAELLWYREQLVRIATGKKPRTGGSTSSALLRGLLHTKWQAWKRSRYLRGPGKPNADTRHAESF